MRAVLKSPLTLRQRIGTIISMKKCLMDQIRDAIKASDKSYSQICRETDIIPSHLSKLVHGERGLSVEALERMADCLGLEVLLRAKSGRKGG